MGGNRIRSRGPGQPRSHTAPRSAAPHARSGRRRAHARRRPAGPHLQPGARHPAVHAGRECPDACAVCAPRLKTDAVTVDVAIVGGGISGLAAAYELQRRGVSVRLFEASDRLGGVIRTDRFDGWVIDGGPDSMLVQKPAAVGLCRELGLGDRLASTLTPRTAYVLRDGHLHAIPEGSFLGFPVRVSALAASQLFSIGGKLRMACEAVLPRSEEDEDESIAAFVRRRFG